MCEGFVLFSFHLSVFRFKVYFCPLCHANMHDCGVSMLSMLFFPAVHVLPAVYRPQETATRGFIFHKMLPFFWFSMSVV